MARLGCSGSAPRALPASPTTFRTSLLPATAAAAPPTTPAATFVGLTLFSGLIPSPFKTVGSKTTWMPLRSAIPARQLPWRMSERQEPVVGHRHHLALGHPAAPRLPGAVRELSEENGGDGRRKVQAGHARAHREREPGVGVREQLVADPVALGAKGQHGALRHAAERLAVGIERDQRAASGAYHARARDRQREVQA